MLYIHILLYCLEYCHSLLYSSSLFYQFYHFYFVMVLFLLFLLFFFGVEDFGSFRSFLLFSSWDRICEGLFSSFFSVSTEEFDCFRSSEGWFCGSAILSQH
eukprot:19575_1